MPTLTLIFMFPEWVRRRPKFGVALVAWALVTAATPALAQTATQVDEQQQRLQRQREQAQLERARRAASVNTAPPEANGPGLLPINEEPCFAIQSVTLSGDRAHDFQWALAAANFDGESPDAVSAHCVGARGINVILARVQNAIVARGWVTTRVVAAPQDVSQGQLELTLVPGVIQAIHLDVDPSHSINGDAALAATPGALLNVRDIDQSLENLKRVPGTDATIDITPAEQGGPGMSDLKIRYRQATFARMSLSVDNSGGESTGLYQGGLTLSADNWLGLQELIYVTLNHSLGGDSPGPGSTRGNTAYVSVPLGYSAVEMSVSHSRYRQTVSGLTTDIVYSGQSRSADLSVSRILHRNQSTKTKTRFGIFARDSSSYVDGFEVQVQRKATGGWQLGVDHESLYEGGKWTAGVNYKHGTGAMGSLPDPGELFGETNSRFRLLTATASISREYLVNDRQWRASSQWRAQTFGTRLTSSDMFSIGGRHSVRGFDGQNALNAEAGWTLRNEIGVDVAPQTAHLYLALDAGSVNGPSVSNLSGRGLTGVALGLRGARDKLSYDISVAAPITHPEAFRSESAVIAFQTNLSF